MSPLLHNDFMGGDTLLGFYLQEVSARLQVLGVDGGASAVCVLLYDGSPGFGVAFATPDYSDCICK